MFYYVIGLIELPKKDDIFHILCLHGVGLTFYENEPWLWSDDWLQAELL